MWMLLAADTAVNVVIISTLGAVVVALITTAVPSVLANRRAKETKETLGEANGHGTAMEMLGTLLDRTGRTDDRLARIEERHSLLADRVARLEQGPPVA